MTRNKRHSIFTLLVPMHLLALALGAMYLPMLKILL